MGKKRISTTAVGGRPRRKKRTVCKRTPSKRTPSKRTVGGRANSRKSRRRKRRRPKKKLLLLILVLLLATAGVLYQLNIIPHPYYTNNDFGIADYHSSVDADGDGIDDQTDFLQGARKYVKTKPKYKSVYYEGGYPTDEYGVCTDVIAQGMLAAGYDLQKLIDEDIRSHPSAYNVDEPDSNIDFRRVPNQNVYLKRHAESLTTDLSQIEQWQGGDIVVFPKHIGVVSDRRNADGIPFMIHHGYPSQVKYEQDVLWRQEDIIAHYRLK